MLFYFPPGADPDVIDFDNAELSDTISRGQFLDLLNAQFFEPEQSQSAAVDVPVLIQVGDEDFLMKFAPLAGEAARYPNSPDLTLETIVDTGHSLNTHLSNRDSVTSIANWIAERFSARARSPRMPYPRKTHQAPSR